MAKVQLLERKFRILKTFLNRWISLDHETFKQEPHFGVQAFLNKAYGQDQVKQGQMGHSKRPFLGTQFEGNVV